MIANQDWPRRSARSLLLLLLATPGHSLARERIIDMLWPELSPDAGMNTLRVALHAARRTLDPYLLRGTTSSYFHSKGDSISLNPEAGIWVDADEFEAALAPLPSAAVAERPSILSSAVSFYGGDLLTDELDVDWSLGRRERLRRAWRDAVIELSEIDTAHRSLDSVPVLERLLNLDAADEAATAP